METPEQVAKEISRRRTFAIISHPDAGKTTMTEKLLLYSGAIHLAGSVKQRRGQQTSSDWMEIERQRGISVTTSVLQFDYRGRRVNLLDTPGHNDFSEDTYRTLAAVDAVIMLIDSVKGVESQTVKLFQVCRMRGLPIVTFVNKLDRPGRDPLELLDEIERVLGIPTSPVTWPIGTGFDFKGLVDRWSNEFMRFECIDHGTKPALVERTPLDQCELRATATDELALLDGATSPFSLEKFQAGQQTPVFFGSAMTNFGVEAFFEKFVDLAPAPRERKTEKGTIAVEGPALSAFIFKIQANLDPNHRDRVAFARICSGRFERGMQVKHLRTGKTMTLNRTLQFLGRDREMIEEAYAGDVIGIWDMGNLRIGDTLSATAISEFEGIPRFSPEHFVRVALVDPTKRKQLKKGLEHLSEEGAVQLFFDRKRLERDPVLGAVGVLQFDVIQHRLQSEYGVPVRFDRLSFDLARWVEVDSGTTFNPDKFEDYERMTCLVDIEQRPVILFRDDWIFNRTKEQNPQLKFLSAVQPGRSVRSAA